MKKLVLFGDSLFAQAGKHRVIMFEDALPGYDVYNCAVGGWNTSDCVNKGPYIAKLQPDVLVISLGTNDAAPWKQVDMETYKANIPKIFATFPESKIVWFLPTPVDEVKTKSVGKDLTNDVVKKYHDAAKQICTDNGVAFIDSFAVFMPLLESGKEYHVEDGVHFTDFAYETIANELAKVLEQA